jgi:hypothetical protein
MRSLAEVQAVVAQALLERDGGALDAVVAGDGLAPDARLAIYRHHVFTSLTAALAATYPVVQRLVGDGFFRYAAHEFIRDHPPAGPCLFEYGGAFAAFLAGFAPCRSLAYLPDVARLEWALNAAMVADDVVPLDLAALAEIPPGDVERITFELDPSLALVISPWPVDTIWRADQAGADPTATVDLDEGGVRLEVRRLGDDVVFRRLAPATAAFRRALLDGRPLGDAVTAAAAEDPGFDATTELRALFEESALRGFRRTPDGEESS